MKVFVSHKSEDLITAKDWAEKLVEQGFNIYLDAYDEQISTVKDRPNHIQGRIKDSTDLLVVITSNTQASWWVPFEIGLSTAFDKRIASLLFKGAGNLPSFLRKWPIIDTYEKWNIYLSELKKNKEELLREHIAQFSSINKSQESISFLQVPRESDMFHNLLMRKFGQIY